MKVNYTFPVAQGDWRTVTLECDDPYVSTGMPAQAHGWTYYRHEVRDRKGSPYTVVAVHHDVSGELISAYDYASARVASKNEFPALRDALRLN